MNKPLIAITGPTASGKSSLGIKLAREVSGEIISADSMQIYKYMNIGTAKVALEEMQGIPHHLIDILEPSAEFSVAEYSLLARNIINDIHNRGKIPVLVGGTSLYVQSILENTEFFDIPRDEHLRNKLVKLASENGNEFLWKKLNNIDADLAQKLHYNNLGRIIRGIEVYKISGKPLSYWQEKSHSKPSPYNHLLIGLSYEDRTILYDKINGRVDDMIKKGLLEEIDILHNKNCSKTAKQAIGYKELWNYAKEPHLMDANVELIKKRTRNYAKRQLTWMRSQKDVININKDNIYSDIGEKTFHLVSDWLEKQRRNSFESSN